MKKVLLVYIYLIFLPGFALAQLLPTSLFRETLSSVNPAVVDIEFLQYKLKYNSVLTYQEQWVGFSDNSNDRQFTFTGFADVIPKKSNFIWGFNLNFDQAASYQVLNTSVRGALRVPLFSKYHYLSVGVGLGGSLAMIRFNKITAPDDFDPVVLLAQSNSLIGFKPRASLGLYYYYYKDGQNSYYGGLSLPNTVRQTFEVENLDTTQNNANFKFQILQHISLQGGYRFNMGRDYFDISAWMKKAVSEANNTNFPFQWNVTAKYHFKDMFWLAGGTTVSLGNKSTLTHAQVSSSFGFDFPNQRRGLLMQFGCAYSYDLGLLNESTIGTPEIFMRFAGL
jgi:type IX secretion system PorP/SprF family membrane protein